MLALGKVSHHPGSLIDGVLTVLSEAALQMLHFCGTSRVTTVAHASKVP